MKNAKLFVTPSLYEGFGRTPVEAAMCRVSVISTKVTSLFDATMGLVNYVENAKDENELADLILEKITNPDSNDKLSEIAYKLKSEYTPKNCAEKYWDIFMTNREQRTENREQSVLQRLKNMILLIVQNLLFLFLLVVKLLRYMEK